MHYFFYVSDAKIRMLYSQLKSKESGQTKTILRGGVGKWFGIERHVEKSSSTDGELMIRLEEVCNWIRKKENVGRIQDIDATWIEDTFSCYVSYPIPSKTGAPVVLFHFHYQEPPKCHPRLAQINTHGLLVGSAAYLMPRDPHAQGKFEPLEPGGHWYHLSRALNEILDGADEKEVFKYEGRWIIPASDSPFRVYDASAPGPLITVKSMFRILHRESAFQGKLSFCLGTPLYVEWIEASNKE